MKPQIDHINRPRQVWERLNIGKSTLQRLVASGALAPPIQLSKRAVGWPESVIAEFIASRSKAGAA